MHKNGLRFNKWWLLGAFLSLFINQPSLFAQKKQVYEGPYILNNDSVQGTAKYDFFLEKGDTVFEGPFEFERAQIFESSGQHMKISALDIAGTFEKGKKNGEWQYASKRLVPGKHFRVTRYDVTYPANGNTLLVTARFRQGQPEGPWRYVRKTVSGGQPEDTLSMGQISFDKGIIQGDIFLEDEAAVLKGQFSNDGFIDGNWIFERRSDTLAKQETRAYRDGWLVKHEIVVNGKPIVLESDWHMEEADSAKTQVLPYGATYMKVLNLATKAAIAKKQISSEGSLKLQSTILANSSFLLEHQGDFYRDGDFSIWKAIDSKGPEIQFGRARVNFYPKTQSEKDTIQWALDVIREVNQLTAAFFENPFVEIGRYSVKELAKIHAVFSQYQEKLPAYDILKKLLENPALEYFPRDKIFAFLIPDLGYPEDVSFEFDGADVDVNHDFPMSIQGDNKVSKTLWEHFRQLSSDVAKAANEAEKLLDIVRKESALSDLEADMVRLRDSVKQLFSASFEDFNPYHKNLSEAALHLADSSFKNYMKQTVEEKKDAIDATIQCYEDLIFVYESLADLPRKLRRLDEEYTRTVWNAYLMVDMDERVKERLYNAVIDHALPFLIMRQRELISCQMARESVNDLQKVYDRMLFLRAEDTKDLERQLRREKKAETILDALGINMQKK
jgi:hypothetical protein